MSKRSVNLLRKIKGDFNVSAANFAAQKRGVVTTTDAAKTLVAGDSGKLVVLAQATASRVLTLPSVASGLSFEIVCGSNGDGGSGAWVITSADGDDLDGFVIGRTGTGVDIDAADTLTGDANVELGDRVTLLSDGTTWFVTALVNDAGDWTAAG